MPAIVYMEKAYYFFRVNEQLETIAYRYDDEQYEQLVTSAAIDPEGLTPTRASRWAMRSSMVLSHPLSHRARFARPRNAAGLTDGRGR